MVLIGDHIQLLNWSLHQKPFENWFLRMENLYKISYFIIYCNCAILLPHTVLTLALNSGYCFFFVVVFVFFFCPLTYGQQIGQNNSPCIWYSITICCSWSTDHTHSRGLRREARKCSIGFQALTKWHTSVTGRKESYVRGFCLWGGDVNAKRLKAEGNENKS